MSRTQALAYAKWIGVNQKSKREKTFMAKRTYRIVGVLAAALSVGAVGVAIAQQFPEQVDGFIGVQAPTVTMASATHIARLSGAEMVPPVTTSGTGTALLQFDDQTNMLRWTIEFSGLTGNVTAAHFHGPAPRGETAGHDAEVTAAPTFSITSPIGGFAQLSEEQAENLLNGLWYVNIHTTAHPGGEIRGQVETR
jgi:hypothetical protein